MKAMTYRAYGPEIALEQTDIDLPALGVGGARVAIKAAGVNPVDFKVMRGDVKFLSGSKFPRVPGFDFAGIVEEVNGATSISVGDRVLGTLGSFRNRLGCYGELVQHPAEDLAPIPQSVNFEEAAALPVAGLTALQAIRDLGRARPGQRILVNGASGGVGHLGVQIAKALQLVVDGTASARNLEYVQSLGVEEAIDYRAGPLPRDRYDIVFDAAGKLTRAEAEPMLRPGGRLVSTEVTRELFLARFAFWRSKKAYSILLKAKREDLVQLLAWVADGTVVVELQQTYPLAQAAEALETLKRGQVRGKIVLAV